MGRLNLVGTMGLPYFKVHVNSTTPFLLICGVEAMVLVKITIPSACLALASKVANTHNRVHDVETLEEKKHNVENMWSSYQGRISKAYNK